MLQDSQKLGAFHTVIGQSTAQLVFEQDIIMPINCDVDKDAIKQRNQRATHNNNESKNSSQINHNCGSGD